MAVREGRWDCQYCGTKGNLGRNKVCQQCGRSRPAGTKFYIPSAEQEVVLDAKLLELAKAGQDWICEFCASSNHPEATICHSCGSAREATSPIQEIKEYAPGEAPAVGDMTFDEESTRPASQLETASKSARPLLLIAGVVAAIVVLCGLIFAAVAIFGGKDVEATVSGFQWARSVNIEAYRTVTEEDWSVPPEGRLNNQRREIHHYDQVLDHYETRQRQVQVQVGQRTYVCGQRDLGNGFFEDIECSEPIYESRSESYEEPVYRQEPVYQTLYNYEIDKWIVDRTEKGSGRDHRPAWPEIRMAENEREGSRDEKYEIYFTDNEDKVYKLDLPLEEWQAYEMSQAVVLKLSTFGDIEEIER